MTNHNPHRPNEPRLENPRHGDHKRQKEFTTLAK